MNKRPNTLREGFAVLAVVGAIAAVTLIGYVVKPSLFPGASRRAAVSVDATSDLLAAEKARSAAAAASVVKIAEANTAAPESPAREFIALEAPVALANLPQADAASLIQAERRRAAVFAGERDEARRLYGLAAEKADKLAADLAEATAARHAADNALVEAAAREHRSRLLISALVIVGLALAGVAAWLKLHFGGLTQGVAAGLTELRHAHPAMAQLATDAFDRALNRGEQKAIRSHT